MSVKDRSIKISLPISGEGENRRVKAEELAKEAIKGKDFKVRRVQPSSLVVALFGSSRKGAGEKHQSYFEAFVEYKAAKAAEKEILSRSARKDYEDFLDAAGLPDRQVSFHGDPDPRDTEWNRLTLPNEGDGKKWVAVPGELKDKIRSEKIKLSQWEDWATEFLVFASDLFELRRAARQKEGRPKSPNSRVTTEWKMRNDALEDRLRRFFQSRLESGKEWGTCVEVAEAIGTSPKTASAFLRQAGDWTGKGMGWIKSAGKARNAQYALTDVGKKHLSKK